MEVTQEYVKTADIQKMLGVSLNTVRNMVKDGRLPKPAISSRNLNLFKLADVKAKLESQAVPA